MDKLEQEIWKTNYIEPMFKKYECVPTKLKYLFIEKDFTIMYGSKREAESRMRYLYDNTETFIFAFENALACFSKTIRKNLLKKYWEEVALDEHYWIMKSGLFFELFPNLSGNYLQDKEFFINFIVERETEKEYVKLIMT